MADEISITTGIRLSNGDLEIPTTTKTRQFDQTTQRGGNPGTVDVGTTEETISFGDCVPGFVEMVNLDGTNFVQVGFSTGVYGFRLIAGGGPALLYLETGAILYAKADTATCKVRVTGVNQ
jgi:hypothetical protein